MTGTVLAVCAHDLVRFARDPGRIVNVVLLPMILLIFMGTGFTALLRTYVPVEGNFYQKWILAGIVLYVVLFASKQAASTMMRDRETGLLSMMLLCATRPSAVVAGKVLSATLQCIGYTMVILVFAPLIGIFLNRTEMALAFALSVATSLMIVTGMYAMATVSRTHEQFLRRMQMITHLGLFLGGAFFPLTALSGAWAWVAWANPLTYAIDGLRGLILEGEVFRPYGTLWSYSVDLQMVLGYMAASTLLLLGRFARWVGMA